MKTYLKQYGVRMAIIIVVAALLIGLAARPKADGSSGCSWNPSGRPSPLMPWWSKVAIGRWQRKSGQRSIVVGRSSTYRTASSAFGRYPSSPRMAASGRGFALRFVFAEVTVDDSLNSYVLRVVLFHVPMNPN